MDTLGRPKVSATRRATAEKKGSTSCKSQWHKIKNYVSLQKSLCMQKLLDLYVVCNS
ncbi:MAG: hypothetical protein R3Y09_01145 [Clostridia bacterium]